MTLTVDVMLINKFVTLMDILRVEFDNYKWKTLIEKSKMITSVNATLYIHGFIMLENRHKTFLEIH